MVHFTSPDFLFNIRHLLQSWSLLIIYVVPVRNYKDCLLIALISTDYVRGYYHAAAFAASRLFIIFPFNPDYALEKTQGKSNVLEWFHNPKNHALLFLFNAILSTSLSGDFYKLNI